MTTIHIQIAGRYSKPMPADLQSALEQAILHHMKAYGVEDCRVITQVEEYEFKRAAALEMYESLELYQATYDDTDHQPTPVEEARCMNAVRAALANARNPIIIAAPVPDPLP